MEGDEEEEDADEDQMLPQGLLLVEEDRGKDGDPDDIR